MNTGNGRVHVVKSLCLGRTTSVRENMTPSWLERFVLHLGLPRNEWQIIKFQDLRFDAMLIFCTIKALRSGERLAIYTFMCFINRRKVGLISVDLINRSHYRWIWSFSQHLARNACRLPGWTTQWRDAKWWIKWKACDSIQMTAKYCGLRRLQCHSKLKHLLSNKGVS